MTIRAPGQECLTRTQEAGREILARFRDKESSAQTLSVNALSKKDPSASSSSIVSVNAGEKTASSYGSPHSRYLDVTA